MLVKKGIPNALIENASTLYSEAFQRKVVKILGPKETFKALLCKGMDGRHAFYAVDEAGQLLGVAGFYSDKSALINIQLRDLIGILGVFRGLLVGFFAEGLYKKKADHPRQLLMDGIVVDVNHRGKGVGSALFENLVTYAASQDFTEIKLEVIDENPKAKKLYERLGFEVRHHKKLSARLSRLIGVSGVYTMVKQI